MTWADIQSKLKLYIGQQQALVVQNFQTLQKVVNLAFGGPEKEKPPEVQNKAELKAKFSAVFSSR